MTRHPYSVYSTTYQSKFGIYFWLSSASITLSSFIFESLQFSLQDLFTQQKIDFGQSTEFIKNSVTLSSPIIFFLLFKFIFDTLLWKFPPIYRLPLMSEKPPDLSGYYKGYVSWIRVEKKNNDKTKGEHPIFVNLLSKLTRLLGFQGIIESVLCKNGMLPTKGRSDILVFIYQNWDSIRVKFEVTHGVYHVLDENRQEREEKNPNAAGNTSVSNMAVIKPVPGSTDIALHHSYQRRREGPDKKYEINLVNNDLQKVNNDLLQNGTSVLRFKESFFENRRTQIQGHYYTDDGTYGNIYIDYQDSLWKYKLKKVGTTIREKLGLGR